MDAVVLAGGRADHKDPLYPLCGEDYKSLLKIAGKPMVQWVLDAISSSKTVEQVILIGLEDQPDLSCFKPLTFLPDKGTLIENIIQGAGYLQAHRPDQSHMLTISADIPAITGEIIDQMSGIFANYDLDICYAVIERSIMESRFPGSRRTFTRFKDLDVCGGDFNCVRKSTALDPRGPWNELIRNRKNPLKQAALIGFDTLLRVLTRTITLDATAERVCKRMGITGKAILSPFAEIGMDVDKPFQFKIVENDLLR